MCKFNRSALQNRLTLDMLLLSEPGVYAMLNLTDGERCLTIHNAATSLEETRQKMKEVSEQAEELSHAMQLKDWFNSWNPKSWLASLLSSLGFTGWGVRLLNMVIPLGCGFLFLMIGPTTVKCTISQTLSSLYPLSVM